MPPAGETAAALDMKLVHEAREGSRRLTPEVLWSIPRVGAPVAGPEGGCIVPVTTYPVDQKKGITRLWLVPRAGSPRPLTGSESSASVPALAPDESTLAFLRKPAGDDDAKPQLHLLPLDGGEASRPLEMPLGVLDARWLADGSGLILIAPLFDDYPTIEATSAEIDRRKDDPVDVRASESRLVRVWDTWLTTGEVAHFFHFDLSSGSCRDLAPDWRGWVDFMSPAGNLDVAPDGSEIVFGGVALEPETDKGTDEVRQRIYRLPLSGGTPRCITPGLTGDEERPRYTPDGAAIIYGTTIERYFYADRARIMRLDRATGKAEPWCAEWDRAPQGWEVAPDGTLVFVAEEDARTHLYALAPDADTPRRIVDGGLLSSPCPAADGSVLFQHQSLHEPVEIGAIGLDGTGGAVS